MTGSQEIQKPQTLARVSASLSWTFLFATAAAPTFAAEFPRVVRGRVTDAEGNGVPGALVEWGPYRAAADERQSVAADSDGPQLARGVDEPAIDACPASQRAADCDFADVVNRTDGPGESPRAACNAAAHPNFADASSSTYRCGNFTRPSGNIATHADIANI